MSGNRPPTISGLGRDRRRQARQGRRPGRHWTQTLARLFATTQPGINQRREHPQPRHALSVAQAPGMSRRWRRDAGKAGRGKL